MARRYADMLRKRWPTNTVYATPQQVMYTAARTILMRHLRSGVPKTTLLSRNGVGGGGLRGWGKGLGASLGRVVVEFEALEMGLHDDGVLYD